MTFIDTKPVRLIAQANRHKHRVALALRRMNGANPSPEAKIAAEALEAMADALLEAVTYFHEGRRVARAATERILG